MTKEVEELKAFLEDVERDKKSVQAELDELLSSKDDVGKNVSHFFVFAQLVSKSSFFRFTIWKRQNALYKIKWKNSD